MPWYWRFVIRMADAVAAQWKVAIVATRRRFYRVAGWHYSARGGECDSSSVSFLPNPHSVRLTHYFFSHCNVLRLGFLFTFCLTILFIVLISNCEVKWINQLVISQHLMIVHNKKLGLGINSRDVISDVVTNQSVQ